MENEEIRECPQCFNELGMNSAYCATCESFLDAQMEESPWP